MFPFEHKSKNTSENFPEVFFILRQKRCSKLIRSSQKSIKIGTLFSFENFTAL